MLNFRIVSVDYYMNPPTRGLDVTYSHFRLSPVKVVPVIRVFGITPEGVKGCIHIHGVFPYMYVPYDGGGNPDSMMYKIATDVDRCINMAPNSTDAPHKQHIFKITLVSGIPFYGYHNKSHQFFKLYFYNPSSLRKAATFFEQGEVCGQIFQPYESHVPFILQFFMDYNLYGMSFMTLSSYTLRQEGNFLGSQGNSSSFKITHCEVEGDAVADSIMNRITNEGGNASQRRNPGLAAIWAEEEARQRQLGSHMDQNTAASQTSHHAEPTKSDVRYVEDLTNAVKARLAEKGIRYSQVGYPVESPETSLIPDASFLDNHNITVLSQSNTLNPIEEEQDSTLDNQNIFDEFDISLIGAIVESINQENRNNEQDLEDDSVLGSQPPAPDGLIPEDNGGEEDEAVDGDLNLLLSANCSHHPEEFASQNNLWNDSFWSGCRDLSQMELVEDISLGFISEEPQQGQEEDVEFLDGNFDIDSSSGEDSKEQISLRTPVKRKKIITVTPERRYEPLKVSIKKSPSVSPRISGTSCSSESSPIEGSPRNSIFKDLQLRASQINELIHSPKHSKSKSTDVAVCRKILQNKTSECELNFSKIHTLNSSYQNRMGEICINNKVTCPDSCSQGIETRIVFSPRPISPTLIPSSPEVEKPTKKKRKHTSLRVRVLTSSQSDSSDSSQMQKKNEKVNGSNFESVQMSHEFSSLGSNQPIHGEASHKEVTTDVAIGVRKSLFPEDENVTSSQLSDCIEPLNISSPSSFHGSQNSDISNSHLDTSQEKFLSFYNATLHPALNFRNRTGIIAPAYCPPSKSQAMQFLSHCEPSILSDRLPFYGNPRDASSSKEVGFDVIRLQSVRVLDLEEFQGSMGPACPRKNNLPTIKCKNKITLVSVKKPPSRKDALLWSKQKKNKPENNKPADANPLKEHVLMAVVGGGMSQDDSVMTLTPCTPEMETTLRAIQCSQDNLLDVTLTHRSPEVSESNKSVNRLSGSKPVTSTPNISQTSAPRYSTPSDVSSVSPKGMCQLTSDLPLDSCQVLSTVPEEPAEAQSKNLTVQGESPVCSGSSNNSNVSSLLKTQLEVRSVVCNIKGSTPNNSGIFKVDLENLQDAHALQLHRYFTLLVMELHISTRGDLNPDPQHDAIVAIFYCVVNDVPAESAKPAFLSGAFLVRPHDETDRRYPLDISISFAETEKDILKQFTAFVLSIDPDLIAGYETEMSSWGYLMQRGWTMDLNLAVDLSRINSAFVPERFSSMLIQTDEDFIRGTEVKLPGRIVLNIWRLMRHQVTLTSYTFENVMYHVLHTRVPKHSLKVLTNWWNHLVPHYRELTIKYYMTRVIGIVKILDQLDFIGCTSELASLFGIQFYEVLSRGSQFRVESMMLRQAKLLNYVPVSPSVKQRANMRAPACLPLIMEPKSRFYGDPVIILDFQSLYPSMMIAYNYCFSTCLGRVENLMQKDRFEFGCTELLVPLEQLGALKDNIHVSPAGVAFVSSGVRKGVLPKMLEEILDTRLMVKKSMKEHKKDKLLQRALHARQLGLKLIANVTYGYTSANFSGRMPCMEVGDSVVSKGRETLERVIEMVNEDPVWGAEVIYGDTDSLFVLCRGRSRQQAFDIGQQIAERATRENPHPVKLKLEKVYQPCILQTKKRYVGFMYETPDQEEPIYEAKGIETVRRDGCPAVGKILEKSLRILFKTKDVSKVKDFVIHQMSRIFTGRVNIQDLTFAREYRGIQGYRPGACVPALKIAREALAVDRRGEPRRGERVPYVVVCGPPGVPLIQLTRPPHQLLSDPALRINADYYLLKAILPPLDRCFTLLGCNVFTWYSEFPKRSLQMVGHHQGEVCLTSKKATISQHFASMCCVLCNELTALGVCPACRQKPSLMAASLVDKISLMQRRHASLSKLCGSCTGHPFFQNSQECISLDCPVLYRLVQSSWDLHRAAFLSQLADKYIPEYF